MTEGFALQRLGLDDLPEARRIESLAYGADAGLAERELTDNRLARYLAAWEGEGDGAIMRGVAGMWCIIEEAHVTTVAVEPSQRGRGIGRLLLHGLVDLARREGMESMTLEVRRSNTVAQQLYRVYGFWPVGERSAYYDNGEDAVIMTTEGLTTEPFQRRWAELEAEIARRFPGLVVDLPEGSLARPVT